MAKYRFKGALNAARWPLIAALQGRTVINPQYDVNVRTPKIFFGSDENLDLGIPQIVYCENVVPTVEGVTSVGYQELIADAGGTTNFDQAVILRDADENNYIFCPGNGSNYILNPGTNTWASTDPVSLPPGTAVTYAYVNGRTFVCYANDDIYEYDVGAGTFLPVTITLPPGVTMADVTGIGSSSNYLIIFTLITVYWSSLVDVTDFTPSSITGAGSATPQDVKGAIVAIRGTSGGFLIYTIKNAVSAQYTNNVRAPFVFKELPNSGGITRPEHVTLDTTSGNQYAWTTSGLLKVNLQYAEPVSGEVNDFLAGRLYNYWDATTKNLVQQLTTTGDFYIKLALIANRYLVISYTPTIISDIYVFTLALVYDTILKRWGQVNIPHTDVFDFQLSSGGGAAYTFTDLGTQTFDDLGTDTFNDLVPDDVSGIEPGSKRTMAFLQLGGAIQLALMDYNKNFNHDGVVVFGRFQLVRAEMMGHQLTTVEGAYGQAWTGSDTFQAYMLNSLDGYNWANGEAMTVLRTQGKSITYGKRIIGLNYMLALTGTFALSSYIMEVTNEGDS